jgi:hypothetical protein
MSRQTNPLQVNLFLGARFKRPRLLLFLSIWKLRFDAAWIYVNERDCHIPPTSLPFPPNFSKSKRKTSGQDEQDCSGLTGS